MGRRHVLRAIKRWFGHRSRLALLAGVVGTGMITVSTTATLGGFTASVTNTANGVQAGSLLMQEQVTPNGGTTTTCLSTAGAAAISTNANNTCAANEFGALTNGAPGASSASTIVITNQGSLAANSFAMTAGPCTATPTAPGGAGATNVGSDTAGFCGKVDVTIEDDTNSSSPTCVYPAGAGACPALSSSYTLASLSTYAASGTALATPLAPGAARTYKFTLGLDSSATNADQAMAATEPITYTFSS